MLQTERRKKRTLEYVMGNNNTFILSEHQRPNWEIFNTVHSA